jgi:hypothetical protein
LIPSGVRVNPRYETSLFLKMHLSKFIFKWFWRCWSSTCSSICRCFCECRSAPGGHRCRRWCFARCEVLLPSAVGKRLDNQEVPWAK